MSKLHFGDHVTLSGKVVRVWEANGRTNVAIEFDRPPDAKQSASVACCESALSPVSVSPMTDEERAALDAADKEAQARENAEADKQGRHRRFLPTWPERMASL